MGNTLPEPSTKKDSHEGYFGDNFYYAVSDMQGWRLTMEDAYIVSSNISQDLNNAHIIGVFDGHGGKLLSSTT